MPQNNNPEGNTNFENLYEVVKTVRFGLTPNKSKLISSSHISKLVDKSIENIEVLAKQNNKSDLSEESVVQKLGLAISKIKNQVELWNDLKHRGDSIIIHEDYYRLLSQKGRFQAFEDVERFSRKKRINEMVKAPSTKNSYLGLNYLGKDKSTDRKNVIISLWDSNINRLSGLESQIKYPLAQYLKATTEADKAHTKPNLIEFKKLAVSFCNVAKLILEPISTSQIVIEKLEKLPDSVENTKLKEFFSGENLNNLRVLINEINFILEYYKANGSLVSFGKVSLNYYTALQKPENYKEKINNLITKLQIKKILEKYKNLDEFDLKKALKFHSENKIEEFLSANLQLTQLEQAQLFKPKPIPFAAKIKLADYLSKNNDYEYEQVYKVLDAFGQSVDIAKDYEKLADKTELNLNTYPIKLAFDYAWENLARKVTGLIPNDRFAKPQSLEFLSYFDVLPENGNFRLYADLLFVADKLAVLEHQSNEIKNKDELNNIIYRIGQTFEKLSQSYIYRAKLKIHLDIIHSALDNPKNLKVNPNFQQAKQEIGKVRGGIKNNLGSDKRNRITGLYEKFKEIAPELGRDFADLREKFKEQDEQTKIGFYAVIVENKYLFAVPLGGTDSRDIVENCLKLEKTEGDLGVKKVVSLTSKSLKKIEHAKIAYPDFHHDLKIGNENYLQGEKDQVIKNKAKLVYIKNCLLKSKMAEEQNWANKFNWADKIQNAQTREEIDKILDVYGYQMQTRFITPESIKDLVENKGCYLLPLVSQDYSGNKTDFIGNVNRFTTDFELALENQDGYRIHPEISLFYQFPTDVIELANHHAQISNRFSRFQLKANLGIEIIPQNHTNIATKKEKNLFMKDKVEYDSKVKEFNQNINNSILSNSDTLIYSLDRGINEIATLCAQNRNGNIQDYIIFKKAKVRRVRKGRIGELNTNEQQIYTYSSYENQSILDLTNIKVETWNCTEIDHPNTKNIHKLLEEIKQNPEDLAIATKLGYFDHLTEANPKITFLVQYPDNSNNIRLKIKVYEREIQKRFSADRDSVKDIINKILENKDLDNLNSSSKKEIIKLVFGLQQQQNTVKLVELLDGDKVKVNELLNEAIFNTMFQPLIDLLIEIHKSSGISKLEQVGELDSLKKGVISNVVGVMNFLYSKQNGVVVLENTANQRESESESQLQREQEKWLGAESYRYLETMLIRKFGRLVSQDNSSIVNLTPPFLNIESLNKQPFKYDGETIQNIYQFGIFYYIPADDTSKICPCCLTNHSKLEQNKKDKFRPRKQTHIFCQVDNCGFTTDRSILSEGKVQELVVKHDKITLNNILKIQNGDQNAAYIIGKNFIKSIIPNNL